MSETVRRLPVYTACIVANLVVGCIDEGDDRAVAPPVGLSTSPKFTFKSLHQRSGKKCALKTDCPYRRGCCGQLGRREYEPLPPSSRIHTFFFLRIILYVYYICTYILYTYILYGLRIFISSSANLSNRSILPRLPERRPHPSSFGGQNVPRE